MIVQTGGLPWNKPKREGLMPKEKLLQVFTEPENPNHENHNFVAWMLGWQGGGLQVPTESRWNLVRNLSRKAEEKNLPKKGK